MPWWIAAPTALLGFLLTYLAFRWQWPKIKARDAQAQFHELHRQLNEEVEARRAMQELGEWKIETLEAQHTRELDLVKLALQKCQVDHAETRGQLEAMTGRFAKELAEAIVKAVAEAAKGGDDAP